MSLLNTPVRVINPKGLKDISGELLMENGKLKLLRAEDYAKFNWEELRLFCHHHARYGLPTVELIQTLKEIINGRSAIEIGSGHGDLGYHLGIPMTDSWVQEREPAVKLFYELGRQPIVKYPPDVEELEALDAIKKHKPQVVVASWVTRYVAPDKNPNGGASIYGVKEDQLLNWVDTYILVGNLDIHADKPICNRVHQRITGPFIWSRAKNPENNVIMVWNPMSLRKRK